MLVLLKCSLLQGLVSKNLAFLNVKKTEFIQEVMLSMSLSQYARCHGCHVSLLGFGLISRGP